MTCKSYLSHIYEQTPAEDNASLLFSERYMQMRPGLTVIKKIHIKYHSLNNLIKIYFTPFIKISRDQPASGVIGLLYQNEVLISTFVTCSVKQQVFSYRGSSGGSLNNCGQLLVISQCKIVTMIQNKENCTAITRTN